MAPPRARRRGPSTYPRGASIRRCGPPIKTSASAPSSFVGPSQNVSEAGADAPPIAVAKHEHRPSPSPRPFSRRQRRADARPPARPARASGEKNKTPGATPPPRCRRASELRELPGRLISKASNRTTRVARRRNFVVVLTGASRAAHPRQIATSRTRRVETDDAARDEEQRQQPDAARVVSDAEHARAFVPRRPFPELEALGRRAQGRQ